VLVQKGGLDAGRERAVVAEPGDAVGVVADAVERVVGGEVVDQKEVDGAFGEVVFEPLAEERRLVAKDGRDDEHCLFIFCLFFILFILFIFFIFLLNLKTKKQIKKNKKTKAVPHYTGKRGVIFLCFYGLIHLFSFQTPIFI